MKYEVNQIQNKHMESEFGTGSFMHPLLIRLLILVMLLDSDCEHGALLFYG